MKIKPKENEPIRDTGTGLLAKRGGTELGQFGRGNVDLYNRPQYQQADGSISTVNSMSFEDENGQEVLVPTIGRDATGNPYQMTDQQAVDNYYNTGEYLGKFNDWRNADAYAEDLHNQQAKYYDRNSPLYDLAVHAYFNRNRVKPWL